MIKGSRVTLLVSSGPEQVAVPDVVGLSRDSAQDSLRGEGLKVVVREEPSADTPEDEVISQDPAAGTEVDAGSQGHDHRVERTRAGGGAGRGRPVRRGRAARR